MKICWFDDYRLGIVEGDEIADVSQALSVLGQSVYPAHAFGDPLIANLDKVLRAARPLMDNAARRPVADAHFLSPVVSPSKIIGVPVNYLKHIEEADVQREAFTARYLGPLEEQGMFLKANSALVGFGNSVVVRFPNRRNDHEMELGMVIGRRGSRISEEMALSHVAGWTISLDFTVRGPEDRSFRKSADGYAVVGPWLTTADEINDPQNLDFYLKVNGERRQASNTRHMIMSLRRQIAYASQFYTLHPGDIIMSGTCEGVGQIEAGDVIECWIDQVGAGRLSVATT